MNYEKANKWKIFFFFFSDAILCVLNSAMTSSRKKMVSLGGSSHSHFPSTTPSSSFSSWSYIVYLFMYLFGWLGWRYPPPLSPPESRSRFLRSFSRFIAVWEIYIYIFFFFSLIHLESTPTGRQRENRISLESMTKREKKGNIQQHTTQKEENLSRGCVCVCVDPVPIFHPG